MKKLLLIASLAALSGCVDKQVFMTKPDGTIAQCNAKGWGLIPMILEEQNLNDCRNFYLHNGYAEK